MNYGTAENSVIDSYRNLDLLLNGINLRPQRILLMHAVNDLTEILRAPDHFGIDLLPHRPIHNPLEAELGFKRVMDRTMGQEVNSEVIRSPEDFGEIVDRVHEQDALGA